MDVVGVFLDVILIALLGCVIYFVTRLHSRLEIVRSGKADLETLLQELVVTTTRAQNSLTGLRDRAEELTETLGKQVRGAENAREELNFLLSSADKHAADLAKAVEQGRQASAAAPIVAAMLAGKPASPVNTETSGPAANTSEKADPRRQAEQDLLKAIEKLR